MIYLLTFIVALSISMTLIPLLVRIAPGIGMIDIPESRKVHAAPIPRVGGIGIVIGALVPMLLWAPGEPWFYSYLFGCIVLLVFGTWDDISELGHYVKFIGQLVAVLPIVYYAGIYVSHLPFMGLDEISPVIGKPFTVFALMGMINAINHSDGLDGLAGGMTILSMFSIGYLAYLADGYLLISIVVASLGGIFGFLRYNNHPARVFMGDGGSQFLGLTLGVLAVVLTQKTNPALSPALPVLILGLPIVDILAVFWLRAYGGMNWFKATKNHIHHRLLDRGFDHYESVVTIYFVQIFFVICALFLSYESDWLIASIYLVTGFSIFFLLTMAEKYNWIAHQDKGESRLSMLIVSIKQHKLFRLAPIKIVELFIPVFFIVIAVISIEIPRDIAVSSFALLSILIVFMLIGKNIKSLLPQAIIYVTAAFIIYIESSYFDANNELLKLFELAYFLSLAVIIGLVVRYSDENRFKTSPMDYLVIFLALLSGILLHDEPLQADIGFMVAKLVIVFYGCEVIISRMKKRWSLFIILTLMSQAILGVKGFI